MTVGMRNGAHTGRTATSAHWQHAASVAVGLLVATGDDRPDSPLLRECVRTSLIKWQMSLRTDGSPARGWRRSGGLHGVTAGLICQLLTEARVFQTDLLLADVERHLRWLLGRSPRPSWTEAATISALADGALLVRDALLLGEARRRLEAFLRLQDDEGWFPERGGADIGCLSLTVDALARIHHQTRWGELREPLERLVRFLVHFVHPDGTFGGCYGSCGTGFLSPYGVELLAPSSPTAATLALVCRERYHRLTAEHFAAWHDDLCTLLGPRVALAGTTAARRLPQASPCPYELKTYTEFPNAGLSIHVSPTCHVVVGGNNGGATHITWFSGAPSVEEPGITAVYQHGSRTSGRWSRSTNQRATPTSAVCSGVLRGSEREGRRSWHMLRKWGWRNRRTSAGRKSSTAAAEHAGRNADGLAGASFLREIFLADGTVVIKDTVRCRPPCQTILCRCPPTVDADRYVDTTCDEHRHRRPPIFVE
ncbi:MAG: hypothetical protein ACE5HE_12100, partial [Phycisphaerae bacterium]